MPPDPQRIRARLVLEKPLENASIRWDENNQPVSVQFGDVYFSKHNGLEETRFVFLAQNNLAERFAALLNGERFCIAETGFGSGLNFLACWQLWEQSRSTNCPATHLHFVSVEKYPLTREDLARALSLWSELKPYADQLIDQYPPQPAWGVHRIRFPLGGVSLTLIFEDAADGLHQLKPCATDGSPAPQNYQFGPGKLKVDAWFLDGFAPAKNPGMWSPELFQSVGALSAENTSFATFTAAGLVKRGLQEAGFSIEKVPGFGRKREMLRGLFSRKSSVTNEEASPAGGETVTARGGARGSTRGNSARLFWHLLSPTDQPASPATNVAIIGGGLAGCMAAAALARRGLRVTIVEQQANLAQAASGNRQGVVYCRLSPHDDPLSRFNLLAQAFANNFYAAPDYNLFGSCGNRCGVLHLAMNDKQRTHYQAIAERYHCEQPQYGSIPFGSASKAKLNHFQWLDEDAASECAGILVKYPGLFVQGAGWLSPQGVCNTLCSHPNIELRLSTEISDLRRTANTWHLLDTQNAQVTTASHVVIANAAAAKKLAQTAELPLNQIRGQVTHIATNHAMGEPLVGLQTVICGDGYVSPPHENMVCAGATFTLRNHEQSLSGQCQQTNLDNLAAMVKMESGITPPPLDGRVGFRTTTPDYFPLVGPVPKTGEMRTRFSPLRHKANAELTTAGKYHENLFCLLGLGSRGLAYSPLAAETLAAVICSEPLPLSQELYRHISPARFLIRELIRGSRKRRD